jgi:hypothetical protein
MIVQAVENVSESSDESEIVIGDGVFQCRCFGHPSEVAVGQVLSGRLFALNARGLRRGESAVPRIEYCGGFSHRMVGELLRTNPAIVKIGGFEIELDTVPPGDVRIGELLECECDRLDLFLAE